MDQLNLSSQCLWENVDKNIRQYDELLELTRPEVEALNKVDTPEVPATPGPVHLTEELVTSDAIISTEPPATVTDNLDSTAEESHMEVEPCESAPEPVLSNHIQEVDPDEDIVLVVDGMDSDADSVHTVGNFQAQATCNSVLPEPNLETDQDTPLGQLTPVSACNSVSESIVNGFTHGSVCDTTSVQCIDNNMTDPDRCDDGHDIASDLDGHDARDDTTSDQSTLLMHISSSAQHTLHDITPSQSPPVTEYTIVSDQSTNDTGHDTAENQSSCDKGHETTTHQVGGNTTTDQSSHDSSTDLAGNDTASDQPSSHTTTDQTHHDTTLDQSSHDPQSLV